MWKSEERKTEMTAPITLAPLDEQTLAELRHRYDDTSDAETRTRYQMLLLSAAGQTSTQIAQIVLRVIELDPHEVGQDTANWTTEKLAEYLGQHTGMLVTEETVRVYLHAYEYVCKRPTWTDAGARPKRKLTMWETRG